MITSAFINLAYSLLSGIIAFLPEGSTLPAAVHTAAVWLGGYLAILDVIFPTTTLVVTVTIAFTVEIAVFGFRTLKWVLSYIPFVGGKG